MRSFSAVCLFWFGLLGADIAAEVTRHWRRVVRNGDRMIVETCAAWAILDRRQPVSRRAACLPLAAGLRTTSAPKSRISVAPGRPLLRRSSRATRWREPTAPFRLPKSKRLGHVVTTYFAPLVIRVSAFLDPVPKLIWNTSAAFRSASTCCGR